MPAHRRPCPHGGLLSLWHDQRGQAGCLGSRVVFHSFVAEQHTRRALLPALAYLLSCLPPLATEECVDTGRCCPLGWPGKHARSRWRGSSRESPRSACRLTRPHVQAVGLRADAPRGLACASHCGVNFTPGAVVSPRVLFRGQWSRSPGPFPPTESRGGTVHLSGLLCPPEMCGAERRSGEDTLPGVCSLWLHPDDQLLVPWSPRATRGEGGCPVSVPSSASLPRECRGQQLGPGHAPGLVSFPGHEPPTCSVTRLRPSHG